jgi:adenosylmethionine-8-amino-7-oxononanoate aminotransferase
MTALLRRHGLLCRAGAAISVAPPLVATAADCDELVGRLDAAIAALEAELGLA